ncbi:beta-1,3-galactosyltransferase 5-like [Homalodisca vitripennis]|uniref:beta-1,3-galactosyltransferase 5-like n=1 Tax=Homalodisca vitripennis TaxID=197043 RepID=UPI001EECE6E4|nr:beta-1,3-galactosyltransferase 5-like [Homalodisca vitripennis]
MTFDHSFVFGMRVNRNVVCYSIIIVCIIWCTCIMYFLNPLNIGNPSHTEEYQEDEAEYVYEFLFGLRKTPATTKVGLEVGLRKRGLRTMRSKYTPGHKLNASHICKDQGANLSLLIVVTSAPYHFGDRLDIRRTWGQLGKQMNVAIAFFVGQTNSFYTSRKILEEEYTYGDIIQGNFIDIYNHLSLKTLSILEWANRYCSRVKFLLKTDDDMFINVPLLLNLIAKDLDIHRSIMGSLSNNLTPVRDTSSKYYLSLGDFPLAEFPQFVCGPAYLMTSDVISELYNHALNSAFFKLEDVLFTGIFARSLKIDLVNIKGFVKQDVGFDNCQVKQAYAIHDVKHNEKFLYWKLFLEENCVEKEQHNLNLDMTHFINITLWRTA